MRTTSSISFFCRQSKADRRGFAPIELAVTIQGKRLINHLPRKERPEDFTKAMSARKCNDVKTFCEAYRQKVNKAITELVEANIDITVSSLREALKEGSVQQYTLNDLIKDFIKYQESRIDNGITMCVYNKYVLSCKYVQDFFSDKKLSDISHSDILRMQSDLTAQFTQQTSAGYLTRIKALFTFAFNDGKIERNPFSNIKITKGNPIIEFLNDNELNTIINFHSDIERIERVKDLFVFACSTGLSYAECATFDRSLIQSVDGIYIYASKRKKTHIDFTSVLLSEAIQILEKYNYSIPVISNQKLNSYLKEIQDLCNINKTLHFHLARKTYGHRLINSGVPMSTIAKCLGHSSTRTTERIYAVVDQSRIAKEVSEAFKK